VDVPDDLAALAAELAGEPLRVEGPHDGDRLALGVEGDGPDPLMVCMHAWMHEQSRNDHTETRLHCSNSFVFF